MKGIPALSAAAFLSLGSGVAYGVNFPKEGTFDFTSCWSGVSHAPVEFSKGNTANTFEMSGTTLSNPPGGIFDKNSYRCVGMSAMLNGKATTRLICEILDPDGDKRMTHFSVAPDGVVVRELVGGTGKYEGMVESGSKVNILGPFPTVRAGTFQNCNRQTGSYKLK